MNKILLFFITLLFTANLSAQKKVLGLPDNLLNPYDVFENAYMVRNFSNKTEEKSELIPWLVVSDRDTNIVYKKASINSKVVTHVHFGDYFYVVDEKKDWIKIAVATAVDELKAETIKKLGWVPKENMLLWAVGLKDIRTKIKKKAVLINQGEDIAQVFKKANSSNGQLVYFHSSPIQESVIDSSGLFPNGFYFIFKKKGKMVLLGKTTDLSTFNINTSLLGWVSEKNILEWNTRIGIEPNYEQTAFEERKRNSQFQFKAFANVDKMKSYVQNKKVRNAFWDKDPVNTAPEDLSISEPLRFSGRLMRFPLLGKISFKKTNYFRSVAVKSYELKEGVGVVNTGLQEMDGFLGTEKVNLFSKIYIPYQIDGSKNPMCSYVVFLTESELLQYQNLLKESLATAEGTSDALKRQSLFKMYVGLIEQLMGEDYFIRKEIEEITKEEILFLFEGMKREGLKLESVDMNVRLSGILGEIELSEEVINLLFERFEKASLELEKIIRLNSRYDFCFETDEQNRYYWLRLDQLF